MNHPQAPAGIRVLLVEDDEVMREELAHLIDQAPDLQLVGEAGDFDTAQRLLRQPHDVLVVDVGLPDGNGIDLLGLQRAQAPAARALVMTVFEDAQTTTQALQAGAAGYMTKTDPDLVLRIRQVAADQHPIDPAVTRHLLAAMGCSATEAPNPYNLTPREIDTLNGLAQGLSYNEIAEALKVSPHTVTDYIKGAYRKLEVNSRSAAVYKAMHVGLLQKPAARARN